MGYWKVGGTAGELEALEIGRVIPEVNPQALKTVLFQAGGEQSHDLPGHDPWIEGRDLGQAGKDIPKETLDKSIGKGKLVISADSVVPGHFHGDPSLHTFALDQDDLAFKGGRRRPEYFSHFFSQDFQSVAGKTP